MSLSRLNIVYILFNLLFFNKLIAQVGGYKSTFQVTPTYTVADRKKVTCGFFKITGKSAMSQVFMDMSTDSFVLPPNFPKGPKGESPCGCHIYLATNYYISSATVNEIYLHYKKKSPKDFIVQEPEEGEKTGDATIYFRVPNHGSGHIYVFGDKQAYTVSYQPEKKKCNCGKK